MSRIFRASDRIPVQIDDITVTIAPLTFNQKIELQSIMISAGKEPLNALKGARLAVKYAVKAVAGIKDMGGNEYKVAMGDDGLITDECVDELLNLQEQPKLIALCSQLIAGVPKEIMDPSTQQPMKGVTVEAAPAKKPKARK